MKIRPNYCERIDPKVGVRRIGPTRRSVSGVVAGKDGAPIPYESSLERDFVVRMLADPSVEKIIAQPEKIEFLSKDGRAEHYTPDYLVIYSIGEYGSRVKAPLLVEVKPAEDWMENWRNWRFKWRAAMRHAWNNGWIFKVFDEGRIRDQLFENLSFLRRYQTLIPDPVLTQAVVGYVRALGDCQIEDVLKGCFPGLRRAEGIAYVWHLLSVGDLTCDLNRELAYSTEVWIDE